MADRNLVLQLLITARDAASEVLGRTGAALRGVGDAVGAALEPLRTFGGLMAAAVGIGGAKELQDRADAYTRLTNSLKVATQSEAEFRAALDTVVAVAGRTNSDLETTASLYSRISQNAKAMNLDQSQVADLTELISKGMQLGGASAAEYGGAVLQLTQAFGSGVLRGEEFNSVMEASPELMRQLAAGLGVAIGELRGLAEQGVLTSTLVSQALLSQKDAIDAAYAKTTQTVEQAFTQLGSKVTLFVGQLNESTGASAAASNAIRFLSENLNVVAATLGGALVASLAKSVAAMAGYVQASLAARAAARDQAIASAAQQQSAVAAAEGNLAAAQAAFNRALAEQRATQAQLAAMESNFGLLASEEALTLARGQASAASSAATAATQRYTAAQAGLVTAQGAGTASVGLFARAMGFLSGPAGLILLAVSAFAALLPMLSKNKTGTDELAASTDRYKDSLAKLNTVQIEARANEISRAIHDQQKIMEDARAGVDVLATGHRNLYEVMKDGRSLAEQLTEAQANLATEQQKLDQLQQNLVTTTDALVRAKQAQQAVDAPQLIQYVQQGLAMANLAKQIDELAKQHKAVTDATQSRITAEIALAQAAGDLQKVETLTLQLAREHAKAAQDQAGFDHAAAVATQARVTALESEYRGYQQITPVQAQALADARADAAAKDAQAKASEALAAQLEFQAEHTLKLHAAQRELIDLTQKEAAEASKNAAVKQVQIDASIALAKARGDEAEAARLISEKSAQTLKDAENEIALTKDLIQQTDLVINRLYAEAAAKGGQTPEQQKYLQGLMDENAERKRTVTGIEAHIPAMQREADQTARMAGPVGELIRLYQNRTAGLQAETDAIGRSYDAQIREQQIALQVAQAKGDTVAAGEASVKIKQLEAEQAQAVADATALEAQNSIALAEAKKLEILASENSAEAKFKEVEAINAQIAATKDAVTAAQQSADAKKAEADAAKTAASANAANAAGLEKTAKAADDAKSSMEGVSVAMAQFQGQTAIGFGFAGVRSFNALINQIKNAIEQANTAAQRLASEGLSANVILAEHLANDLETSDSYLNAAARTAAVDLRNALAAAKQEAMEMSQALADAAEDLRKQFLQTSGDTRALLDIEHQENLDRLKEMSEKAGTAGRTQYEEAKRQADALYALKLQQFEDEKKSSQSSADTTVSGLNRVTEAANSTKAAMAALNAADLSGLQGQLSGVGKAANDLRAVL